MTKFDTWNHVVRPGGCKDPLACGADVAADGWNSIYDSCCDSFFADAPDRKMQTSWVAALRVELAPRGVIFLMNLSQYLKSIRGFFHSNARDQDHPDLLSSALAAAQRSDRRFSLVMADIDRFKLINDELGHAAGVVTLRAVAQSLRASLRANDQACAASTPPRY